VWENYVLFPDVSDKKIGHHHWCHYTIYHHQIGDIFYKDNVISGKIMKREGPNNRRKENWKQKEILFLDDDYFRNNENCSKILRKEDREGDVLSYLFGGNETWRIYNSDDDSFSSCIFPVAVVFQHKCNKNGKNEWNKMVYRFYDRLSNTTLSTFWSTLSKVSGRHCQIHSRHCQNKFYSKSTAWNVERLKNHYENLLNNIKLRFAFCSLATTNIPSIETRKLVLRH